MKMLVEIDWDQAETLIRDRLRQDYIDQMTIWKAQPDCAELARDLLGVIRYYSAPHEFDEWFETVKDL